MFYNIPSPSLNRLSIEIYYMKYRSRTDIISQVLDAANGGATKTKIMYKAYLSYSQLNEYLSTLVEKDLLSYSPADRLYTTTGKGLEFLKAYERMADISGEMKKVAA